MQWILIIMGLCCVNVAIASGDAYASQLKGELVKPTQEPKESVTIKWIKTLNDTETDRICSKYMGREENGNILGCSIDIGPSECLIITTMPRYVRNDEAMDTLGHEVLHCFVDKFHM